LLQAFERNRGEDAGALANHPRSLCCETLVINEIQNVDARN
jgi:hypothetical protein